MHWRRIIDYTKAMLQRNFPPAVTVWSVTIPPRPNMLTIGRKDGLVNWSSPTMNKRRVCQFWRCKKNPCYLWWSFRLSCLCGLAANPSSSPFSTWPYPPFETVREWANGKERKAIIRALWKYYAGSFKRGLLGSELRWREVTVWTELRRTDRDWDHYQLQHTAISPHL